MIGPKHTCYAERRKLEALREAIRSGDESGPSVPAAEVYAELRRLIAARFAETR